jgi:hypothetical protein
LAAPAHISASSWRLITRPKHFFSDPSHLPPLCGYVKALHFTWPRLRDAIDPSAILDCFERSEPHTLALHSCEPHDLGEQTIRRCFAKFPRASITTLELHEISSTHGTLLVLLSLFPNVDNLTISPGRWWECGPVHGLGKNDNDGIVQHISPSCLGGSFKFLSSPSLGHWGLGCGELLHTLATLPLQFQNVSLDVDVQSTEDVSTFLSSCSETARKIFVGPAYRKSRPCIPQSHACSVGECVVGEMTNWTLISDFENLEELRIGVWSADQPLPSLLLRSVTSSCLRRVIIIEVEKGSFW